jgi:hypothetical protein
MAAQMKKALGCCSFIGLFLIGFALVISACSTLLVWEAYAQSNEAGSWGLRSENGGWFDLDLEPGESFEGALLAVNNSDTAVDLIIEAVDSINGQRGGFSLSLETDRQLTSWLDFQERLITLAPYETLRIPFKLLVPLDALAGDYGAGFVAFEPVQESAGNGIQITIINRSGVSILVRVGQPATCALEFQGVEINPSREGGAVILLNLLNAGNVAIRGNGHIKLQSTSTVGSTWEDALIVGFSLPGRISYLVNAPLDPGAYSLDAQLWSIDDRECRAELSSFFVLEAPTKPKPKIQQVIERATAQVSTGDFSRLLLGASLLVAALILGVVLILWLRSIGREGGR